MKPMTHLKFFSEKGGNKMEIHKSQTGLKTINLLVYGQSGVGKTVFCSTAPSPLFLDAEGGLLSIQHSVDFIKIDSLMGLWEAYKFLKEEKHNYKTVILDSLTEIVKYLLDSIVQERNVELPTIREWGILSDKVRKIVRLFRDLPMNLIVTCLTSEQKDEDTGRICINPAVFGKLEKELPAYFDIVLYMYAIKDPKSSEVKRSLLTESTEKYVAKDRSNKLDRVEVPNFQTIYNKIFQKEVVRR